MLYRLWANGSDLGNVIPGDVPLATLQQTTPNVEYLVLEEGVTPDEHKKEIAIQSAIPAPFIDAEFDFAMPVTTLDTLLTEELAKVREKNAKLEAENLELRLANGKLELQLAEYNQV